MTVLLSVVLAGTLSATGAPVPAFNFDGPTASAISARPEGVVMRGSQRIPALGRVELGARDRITDLRARYGDRATLNAHLVAGDDRYDIELLSTGFPPAAALKGQKVDAVPPAEAFPIGGGVVIDQDVFGLTGVGPRALTRAHAAITVAGIAKVEKNGKTLTRGARLFATALTDGGDYPARSLVLFIDGLPRDAEQGGSLRVVFNKVVMDVDGTAIPAAVAGNAAGGNGVGGSGAGAASSASGGGATGGGGPAYGNTNSAPATIGGAQAQNPALITNYVPGSAIATTNAPVGPESSAQNGAAQTTINSQANPSITNVPVATAGGALPGSSGIPEPSRDLTEAVNGRPNLNPVNPAVNGSIFPQPNGIPTTANPLVNNTNTPSAPIAGTPGAPMTGTPGAPTTGTPGSPVVVAAPPMTGPENQAAAGPGGFNFPRGNYPGTAQWASSQTAVVGRETGSQQFATPGIPLTPTPANDFPAPPLIQTPSPLNAQPFGSAVPQTPTPLSAGTAAAPATPGSIAR